MTAQCVCDSGWMGDDCSQLMKPKAPPIERKSKERNQDAAIKPINGNNSSLIRESGMTSAEQRSGRAPYPWEASTLPNIQSNRTVPPGDETGVVNGEECPLNCNDRGQCVNGKCECDEGYGSESCTEILQWHATVPFKDFVVTGIICIIVSVTAPVGVYFVNKAR